MNEPCFVLHALPCNCSVSVARVDILLTHIVLKKKDDGVLTFLFWDRRHLSVEKNRILYVKLYPEISAVTRDNPPIASFIARVVCSAGGRKTLIHPGIS